MQKSSLQQLFGQPQTHINGSDSSNNLLESIHRAHATKRRTDEDLNAIHSDKKLKKIKIENHLSKNEPIDFHLTFDHRNLSNENPETDDFQKSQEQAVLEALEEALLSLEDDTSDEELSSDEDNINNDDNFSVESFNEIEKNTSVNNDNIGFHLRFSEILKNSSSTATSAYNNNINSKQLLRTMIKKSIPVQASLFDVERKAKAWAETKPRLNNLNDNLNNVFKLYSLNSHENNIPIAFYKEGASSKKASIIMETLMWEIALLLNVEKCFTPTKKTVLAINTLKTKRQGNKHFIWTPTGEGQIGNVPCKTREGSIQKTQEGITLSEYLSNSHNPNSKIFKKQIIQATLITCLFGMFDAHERNMIVNPDRDIIFFDNTCSMPSSNIALKRDGDDSLECPYRSGLFQFDEYNETLDPSSREYIKIEVDKYANSINSLEKYLRSPMKNKELNTLPKGWWNTDDSMEALRERVKNLSEAIENPEVKNLRDLVFYVNPTFKYLSAVNLIHQHITEINSHRTLSESLKKNILSRSHDIKESLERLIGHNVDPALVLTWCQDPSLSFDAILEKGCEEYLKRKDFNFSNGNKYRNELFLKRDQLIKEYKDKAKVDLKDC